MCAIAFVPHEAAFDGSLTPTALRLLMYLGGEHPDSKKWDKYWCWESWSDLAEHLSNPYFHYSSKTMKDALYLLRKQGYLQRIVRVILPKVDGGRTVRHLCYRVVITLEDRRPAVSDQCALERKRA